MQYELYTVVYTKGLLYAYTVRSMMRCRLILSFSVFAGEESKTCMSEWMIPLFLYLSLSISTFILISTALYLTCGVLRKLQQTRQLEHPQTLSEAQHLLYLPTLSLEEDLCILLPHILATHVTFPFLAVCISTYKSFFPFTLSLTN